MSHLRILKMRVKYPKIVSHRKFGFDSDEVIDVVNPKLPVEMFGSFGQRQL